MVSQIFLQVVFMYRYQMALYLFMIHYLVQPAYRSHPHTQDTVGQTTCSVLILRSFGFEQLQCFVRITSSERHYVNRIGRFKTFPLNLLDKVFAIEQGTFHILLAFSQQSFIFLGRLLQCLAHFYHSSQGAQVEAGAHAVRSPELNIVGIMVRFF
ncbi:hypothetical protein SDC9_162039 [bioreactor metagenome]|uniref:Uncharacterized protein n=1 Tax=bioreactor metagenome TaxID=1076179 RepID=A0A645FMD4_9ZZZZ